MKMKVRLCLLGSLVCTPFLALADDSSTAEEKGIMQNPVGAILVTEGLFVLNAGMATLNPQAYGILGALLFPLGAAEAGGSKTTFWVGLVAGEILAAYNIAELDKDEQTDKEIFIANMIAWHVFTAVVGSTAWIKGDLDDSRNVLLRYEPRHDGGMLKVAYAF